MKLINRKGLKSEKGITYSESHLWRLVRDGKFPRPIRLGANRNAWIESEIDAHIEAKIAERDAQPLPVATAPSPVIAKVSKRRRN